MSANGAEDEASATTIANRARYEGQATVSANGAEYESQGQARSASPLVTNTHEEKGLKGRNISPFQGSSAF